nr:MAG TPA: hypothetical protein [Herelleviridae sp.]
MTAMERTKLIDEVVEDVKRWATSVGYTVQPHFDQSFHQVLWSDTWCLTDCLSMLWGLLTGGSRFIYPVVSFMYECMSNCPKLEAYYKDPERVKLPRYTLGDRADWRDV